MTHKQPIMPLKIIEAIALIIGCVIFFFLLNQHMSLNHSPDTPWGMPATFLMIIGTLYVFQLNDKRIAEKSKEVLRVITGFAAGYWLFCSFRYLGIVQWPLAHAENLRTYLFLLFSHVVFVMTVFACLLFIVGKRRNLFELLSWGEWGRGFLGHQGRAVLVIVVLGMWVWAVYSLVTVTLPTPERIFWFMMIALAKAVLNGSAEEIAYRGIIQSVVIDRFGTTYGIIIQACLYTAFHLHLGPAFFGYMGFIVAVMGLGLLFGTGTYLTGGVGWACAIHVAISLMIEWQNLS